MSSDDDSSSEVEEVSLALDEDGRVQYGGFINYDFRSFGSALSTEAVSQLIPAIERAFSARQSKKGGRYSSGQTFWVRADATPRNCLERLALDIFKFHASGAAYDPSASGAEWWTLAMDDEDEVGFHFDMDYGLESEGVHCTPHVGTVTYLW